MKPIVYQARFFLFSYFIFLLVVVVFFLVQGHEKSFLLINGTYGYWSDVFFKNVTNLGDGIVFGVLILSCLIVDRKQVLTVVLSLVSTTLVACLLKRVVFSNTLRPKAYFHNNLLHFVKGIEVHSYGSFPSGHTITAFTIGLLLTLFARDKWVGLINLFIAALVGYSRLYLGQHFVIDVIAGSVIGVICTLGCVYFASKIELTSINLPFQRSRNGRNETRNPDECFQTPHEGLI